MEPDRPAIEDYIAANRVTYTDQAIRETLIAAGHEPAAIDAAFARLGIAAPAGQPRKPATGLVTFAWILLVIGGLIGLAGFGMGGSYVADASLPVFLLAFGGIGLALILLLRLAVRRYWIAGGGAWLIGLALLPVFFFLLYGSCAAAFATRATVPPTTVTDGTMTLTIDPPLAFHGSGAAQCLDAGNGPEVDSFHVGSIDGKTVHVTMLGAGLVQANGAQSPNLALRGYAEISVVNDAGVGAYYFSEPGDPSTSLPEDPSFHLQTPADGSRSIRFERLRKASESDPNFGPDAISGTITWTC